MLHRAHRITRRQDFEAVIRGGRRAGGSALVVHLAEVGSLPEKDATTRAGLVVGKAVGNAVNRNRVKRRLRHLLRERLDLLPEGTALVVRALPAAASASWAQLGGELDAAVARAGRRSGRS